MDLELKSIVKRLHDGQCPNCYNKLSYISNECHGGKLENNGMVAMDQIIKEKHYVYCEICGYKSEAIQIGLKLVPIDRIDENDINWDKKYLEDSILVWGEHGENPFDKDKA